jgi:hypothetical protein
MNMGFSAIPSGLASFSLPQLPSASVAVEHMAFARQLMRSGMGDAVSSLRQSVGSPASFSAMVKSFGQTLPSTVSQSRVSTPSMESTLKVPTPLSAEVALSASPKALSKPATAPSASSSLDVATKLFSQSIGSIGAQFTGMASALDNAVMHARDKFQMQSLGMMSANKFMQAAYKPQTAMFS